MTAPRTGRPVLLVGGGKMGGALAAGWLGAGWKPGELLVVEPDAGRHAALQAQGVERVLASVAELPAGPEPVALVLAVKPQVMATTAPDYRSRIGKATLVLSIAAGKTIASFEDIFGTTTGIVRAMPNTPAAVGQGATVLVANAAATTAQRELASTLMAAVGLVEWVEDEDLMHVVTALSGGGPAYVFLLIETLAEAGRRQGLDADLAMRLARSTVCGSGELARRSSSPASQLRIDVTSPGGTTAEALRVLMADNGILPLFEMAIRAAAARSLQLA